MVCMSCVDAHVMCLTRAADTAAQSLQVNTTLISNWALFSYTNPESYELDFTVAPEARIDTSSLTSRVEDMLADNQIHSVQVRRVSGEMTSCGQCCVSDSISCDNVRVMCVQCVGTACARATRRAPMSGAPQAVPETALHTLHR